LAQNDGGTTCAPPAQLPLPMRNGRNGQPNYTPPWVPKRERTIHAPTLFTSLPCRGWATGHVLKYLAPPWVRTRFPSVPPSLGPRPVFLFLAAGEGTSYLCTTKADEETKAAAAVSPGSNMTGVDLLSRRQQIRHKITIPIVEGGEILVVSGRLMGTKTTTMRSGNLEA
jgi:hypothetical protein